MLLPDPRENLARAQAELVRVLTRRARMPDNVDALRLRATADALARKRARAVGRAWPALTRALGERFQEQFAVFAAKTTIPRQGGPLADGRAFARYLEERRELPDEGCLEALAVNLRYATVHDGLIPRRLPSVRIGWFPESFGLVVAARVPWLGEYWWYRVGGRHDCQ